MKRERLLYVYYLLVDYWKVMERLLYVDLELKNIYNFNEK